VLTIHFNTQQIIQLASGEVFGQDQPIALKLLGSERSFQALEGERFLLSALLFEKKNQFIFATHSVAKRKSFWFSRYIIFAMHLDICYV